MSALDPFVLWDAGFLLSLFGTLGIILFTSLLTRPFHRLEHIPLIFFLIEVGTGRSARSTSASGCMPMLRMAATECWVGFVLSSPACPM